MQNRIQISVLVKLLRSGKKDVTDERYGGPTSGTESNVERDEGSEK
jgi:hypothetical protein